MSNGLLRRLAALLAVSLVFSCFMPAGQPIHAERRTPVSLAAGDTGPWVRTLQVKLAQWNVYWGPVSGRFDSRTRQAVMEFQSKNSLPVTGRVDDATWAALGFASAYTKTAYTPSRSGSWEDDVQLLARVVAAEAGDEPFEGQVAVAAVIINRTKSPQFPPTVSGVIFEPWAFESVASGYIWAVAVTAQNIRAATAALDGWDPSFGALYFWNPFKAVTSWIWTRPIIRQIGRHVFAR